MHDWSERDLLHDLPCIHSNVQHVPSTGSYLSQSGNCGHVSKKQPTALPAKHLHFSQTSFPSGVKYCPDDTGCFKLLQHTPPEMSMFVDERIIQGCKWTSACLPW